MYQLSSQHGKRYMTSYVGALAIYIVALAMLFYILVVFTHTSLTYVYYLYRYGLFYTMYMNLYTATLLLFITCLAAYIPLQKYRILRYITILASITLVFTNYTHLILYSTVKQVSVAVYPLMLILTSNHTGNSVMSFDWGQSAIAFLTYYAIRQHLTKKATSASA